MTRPSPRTGGRIGALAVLPVFFKLAGRRVLVAGGDPGAAWKAELLAAAGAKVTVVAADPCATMDALAHAGTFTLVRRPWGPDDCRGATLAVGAMGNDAEAEAFRCAAKLAGVPVNIVDRPAWCDFQFGTIVERGPLVIGISTDGAAPVLGQTVRARLEALLPAELATWMRAARDWRPEVQRLGLSFRERRAFWTRFATLALSGDRAPNATDLTALLTSPNVRADDFAWIDIGTGNLEDVTFRSMRLLQSADLIVHDADAPSALLELGRREAERVPAGRGTYRPADHVGEGRRVVLLSAVPPAC